MKQVLICFLLLISVAVPGQNKKLIDKAATNETKALFRNLDKLSQSHILFCHQHATEYGHGWSGDADRSDVKSVTGSLRLLSVLTLVAFPAGLIVRLKTTNQH